MPTLCLPTRAESTLANFPLPQTHASFRKTSHQSALNFLPKNVLLLSQDPGLISFPLSQPSASPWEKALLIHCGLHGTDKGRGCYHHVLPVEHGQCSFVGY